MGDQNHVSVDGLRLRWIVKNEPVRNAIHVLDDALDPNSAQKPYENESGELHPISKVSISTQPLKQLSVTLPDLENIITYNECPEDHPDYDEDTGIPYDEPTCEVTATNGEFITIGDYVEAVYPWLISLRDRYFEDAPIPGEEFDPDSELWVKPWSMIDGVELHYADPNGGNAKNETVWNSTAKMASNIQNDSQEDEERPYVTDEMKMEIIERYYKESGMDKLLFTGEHQ